MSFLKIKIKIKTERRIIYAAFQCSAGSYRTKSKRTSHRHNLQETQLLAYADRYRR
jgi:hypothetical protein